MSTLSTSAILEGMANALPTHPPGDTGSDLASSYEAIALLIHAYLSALNFRLIGFNEGQPLAECQSLAPRLPASWNAGFGSLSFVYKHKQSAMDFVFRIDRMGAKVEVRGLAVGADSIYRFERTVRDVVQANNLPVRIKLVPSSSSSEGDDVAPQQQQQEEDRSDLPNQLRAVFVSDQAIADILNDLKVEIVQKLIPKLQQQGYVETPTDTEAEETARSERRQQEARDPNRPFRGDPRPPHAPYPEPGPLPEMARPRPGAPSADFPPPGFDDEYDIHRPPHGAGGLVMPGRSPYNIGHDDLHPPGLGPHDPLRPSFGGGGLVQPGSSGMHPTFDDPLFAGQGGRGDGFGGGRGGDGYDPQAPPGARWDPLGPGGGPRFPGPGRGPGGNNPFGGDII